MARLEIEPDQGGRFPWWIPALIGGLILGAILGALVTRQITAAPPADQLDVSNVSRVLEYGDLPRSFAYGGRMWEAADSGRFAQDLELVRIGPTVAGHAIHYERGTPTQPYEALYMPAAQTGPYADVYVRYRPADQQQP